jgi:hypothetical protein
MRKRIGILEGKIMGKTLSEMGFSVLVQTKDGEEFGYGDPEDMGFGGDKIMQLTFEGGKKHHFDVEEIESVVLIRDVGNE